MSDSDFARMARRVHRNIMMRMSELQPSDITPAIIADFLQAIDLFDESMELKENAVSKRDAGTQERVMLANAIYYQLTMLADFGKVCYAPINEAKYNDYIIYDLPAAPKATENKTDVAKTDVAPAEEIKPAVTPTEETNTDNQA